MPKTRDKPLSNKPAWSARCDCYNGHNSSSGRCTCRSSELPNGTYVHGVVDPTRHEGESAVCEECRKNCPIGSGTRKEGA